MTHGSIPTKRQIRRFLDADGWEKVRSNDHERYTKTLGDGAVLRTKVSHGRGPAFPSVGLWNKVWRHQLALESESQFWEVLASSSPAPRSTTTSPMTKRVVAKPFWLVRFLIEVGKADEQDVLMLSESEAMKLYIQLSSGMDS